MYRSLTVSSALLMAALVPFPSEGANRRQSYDELAGASDKVVLGTVGVKSSHWGADSRIYTDVVVYPDVTVKGTDDAALIVQVAGGTVGDTTMAVSDGPELPGGERVLVFLKRDAGHYVVAGRSAGSIATSSPEAADALDSAFTQVERTAGGHRSAKRNLAASYLSRSGGSTVSRAATSSAAAAAQVGCYSTDGAKWGVSSATYKIGSSIPPDWAGSIDASAATWGRAGAAFKLVNDPNSTNELSYADLVAKYGSSYSNTFAVTTTWASNSTGRISKATIEVNTKWQWSTAADPNMADVQNILTHEFGHWMRLLDIYSPAECADVTMWGSAAFGETKKRTLEQADIDGFLSLYGPGGTTLSAPALSSPANGATGVSATSTLTWGAVSGATSYDVYFGNTASPGLAATVSGTSYQPGTLSAGATYYWRVVAKNSGSNVSSATVSFTVAGTSGGGAGAAVNLLSPTDGATNVSLSPVLRWSAVTGAQAYDIFIGTTSAPNVIGSVQATAVTVTGFQSGTQYYWKVVARTASGPVSSPVASFRTN